MTDILYICFDYILCDDGCRYLKWKNHPAVFLKLKICGHYERVGGAAQKTIRQHHTATPYDLKSNDYSNSSKPPRKFGRVPHPNFSDSKYNKKYVDKWNAAIQKNSLDAAIQKNSLDTATQKNS
ncbi:hypothetical protein [Methanolapillus ohkumae]|uniref:Uncharacterized protein n=1 Tax=Methanolapillus ohkumae TaxID=3028298 RepID=A0AA96ZV61_9EURY|nr:hypothetical protein MsAm2_01340 [Methanosarcinaceae archaeon Am2]